MSNYPSKEEAEKAAIEKQIKYGEKFIVHQDEDPRFWWATRKSAIQNGRKE